MHGARRRGSGYGPVGRCGGGGSAAGEARAGARDGTRRLLLEQLQPLLRIMEPLNQEIDVADGSLVEKGKAEPVVRRLKTAPGIGPVTALAYVATLDDVRRFRTAHQVESYIGLVPREHSSGEHQVRGRITKTGDKRLRWLLVEAAWRVMRSRRPDLAALQAWTAKIATRRGRSVAAVALARRLAGILYAMWRDEQDYNAERLAPRPRLAQAS